MLDRFTVALVGGPFGLEGFCKVHSLSGETEHIAQLSEVVLRKDGKERVYTIADTVSSGANFLVRFAGIDTPEAARLLTGSELVVPRENAAPLEPGEYYVEDLRGCALVHGGNEVATILDVLEGGGGQLLEVKTSEGQRFVPFRDEFIGKVDVKNRRVELLNTWILE